VGQLFWALELVNGVVIKFLQYKKNVFEKMSGRKGGLAIESLALLVTALISSALVFYLVQSGVVSVSGSGDGTSVSNSQSEFLNIEYLPISKGGTLVIQDFSLCYNEDVNKETLKCKQERELFFLGDEVHFSFSVISSSYLGSIELLENYRLRGPDNEILLDVNSRDDYEFATDTEESIQQVYFEDYFILDSVDPIGEYTLELVVKNNLIGKETVVRKKINVN
jgi:hypothetical protein